jgi:hypothetical protein
MTPNIQHDGPLKWNAAGMAPSRRQSLDRLSAASQYAWIQLADPVMRAQYERGLTTKKSAYALAVADFLNPPEIRAVSLEQYTGHAGEPINLHVVDDFQVAGVRVVLLNSEGTPIEQGEARDQGNNTWCYDTRHTVPSFRRLTIVITAYDIPGNIDQQTIHLLIGPTSGVDPAQRLPALIAGSYPR